VNGVTELVGWLTLIRQRSYPAIRTKASKPSLQ
jgi:hypothetical protein